MSTMISVFMMVIAGGAMFNLTSQDVFAINRLQKSTQARHLAEAGLSEAISKLRTAWASNATYPAVNLGSGSYQSIVKTVSGRTLVTSTGTVDKVKRSVTAEVTPTLDSAMNYALASGAWLEYEFEASNSSGKVVGNMYSGKQMEFEVRAGNPKTVVTGDIRAGSYFEHLSDVTLTGTSTANYSTYVPFPTVDLNHFQAIAQANGQYYAGSKVFASGQIPLNPPGGVVYVAGSCTIYGIQATTATVVVGGSLAIQKTGNAYPMISITKSDNMPALVVMGDTTFQSSGNGGAYMTVKGFIYSGRTFTFKPNHSQFRLVGQLVARGAIEIDPEASSLADVAYWSQNPAGITAPSSQFGVESYNT